MRTTEPQPHDNPSQSSPSCSGSCAEPSRHSLCITGQGSCVLMWLQPWSSSSMAIPCSQGKAGGLKGAVKQQKMELVPQSVSSSSRASAQDCAATPWHWQREAPRAGHGTRVDQIQHPPSLAGTKPLLQTHPPHPPCPLPSRTCQAALAAAFPDHSTGGECI